MMNMFFKLHNHVCVSILQLCAWGGCGIPQGYVKQSDDKNGRKKAQIALKTIERVTCRVSKAHE